jgi:hypothetical protein
MDRVLLYIQRDPLALILEDFDDANRSLTMKMDPSMLADLILALAEPPSVKQALKEKGAQLVLPDARGSWIHKLARVCWPH